MAIDRISDNETMDLAFVQFPAPFGVEWRGREISLNSKIADLSIQKMQFSSRFLEQKHPLNVKPLLNYSIQELSEALAEIDDPSFKIEKFRDLSANKKHKNKKKWWIIAAIVVVAVAVTVATGNPAAGAAAGGATAGAVNKPNSNDKHKEEDHKKNDQPKSSSPPQPAISPTSTPVFQASNIPSFQTSLPPLPSSQVGPISSINELIKSPTLTASEMNSGRPSTFNPMPTNWTPPNISQEIARSPNISPLQTEYKFNEYPRIHPENSFPNKNPSNIPQTTISPHSSNSQVPFPSTSSYPFRLPIGPDALPPELSSSLSPYREQGQKALANGNYSQAVLDFGKAIETNPTNPTPYLERGIAHFGLGQYDRSLEDYQKYTSQIQQTHPLSIPEFSLGFAKGLPKGIYDSGKGLYSFATDLVKHPINTSRQMYESLTLLSQLTRSGEWRELAEALAPEVHQLVKEWDTLPSEKRGELAGYAFGKYGADLLVPGAVAKVVSKGVKGAQELSAVYRGLKTAEQTLLLESVAELGSGAKVGELFQSYQKTLTLGRELGFSKRELTQLKQVGQMEGTIAQAYENVVKNPAMKESFEFFKKAETFLEPYTKQFMLEAQAKTLIQQAGVRTFPRPLGVPENFIVRITDRGAGIEYMHPINTHISVRIMPGKPHSPNPSQQKPYVIQKKDGKAFDKGGNLVEQKSTEAHIPLEEFIYRD